MPANTMECPEWFLQAFNTEKIGSDSITETGWMENRLYFDDMSLHDLLQNMERKYGVSFKMSDAALDTIHFTGSFQNETVS
jgi:ferric-dicitrate binding protein FerR (iron transport regulator)